MASPGEKFMKRIFGGRAKPAERSSDRFPILDAYEDSAPSQQNAINIVPGWNHAFPPEFGLVAGEAHMHWDPRILWGVEQFGSLEGRSVLELGPLEGSHTALLERLGAERVDAIEANRLAYLRCLIAKEVFDLKRSRFYLGDFLKWLERDDLSYDLIVACGVLYHMVDPIKLLELISRRADSVIIWTHYFDDEAMPVGDQRRVPFQSQKAPHQEYIRTVNFRGLEVSLHERSYYQAWKNSAFCGGPIDRHYWMEKPQLIAVLRALGYTDVRINHDDPQQVNGPSVTIFAKRER